jgi:hypothetical protein
MVASYTPSEAPVPSTGTIDNYREFCARIIGNLRQEHAQINRADPEKWTKIVLTIVEKSAMEASSEQNEASSSSLKISGAPSLQPPTRCCSKIQHRRRRSFAVEEEARLSLPMTTLGVEK